MSGPAHFHEQIESPWTLEQVASVRPGHAVVLLESADGLPILLATTSDVRAFLAGRLLPEADSARPSRGRLDLRAVAARARIARAGSRFESEWLYVEAARALMPREYRALLDRWRAWFILVDPGERTPRLRKIEIAAEDVPLGPDAVLLGPIRDKEAAGRYMERLTEIFDLCRDERLLVQAPNATACPYKEMGRCPAPCDGTETLDAYRARMGEAVRFAAACIEDEAARIEKAMAAAAAGLRFEEAASCKRVLERLAPLRGRAGAAYAHVARLEDARWVLTARGEREGWARVLVCLFGVIQAVADVAGAAGEDEVGALARTISARSQAERPPRGRLRAAQREGLALMSRWLHKGERRRAVGIQRLGPNPLAAADLRRLILAALRPAPRQEGEPPEMELEGGAG